MKVSKMGIVIVIVREVLVIMMCLQRQLRCLLNCKFISKIMVKILTFYDYIYKMYLENVIF